MQFQCDRLFQHDRNHLFVESLSSDKRMKGEGGSARLSEKNIEEAHSLSPIEEESDSAPFFKEVSRNFAINETEESCGNMTGSLYKECQRMLRKVEGNRDVY